MKGLVAVVLLAAVFGTAAPAHARSAASASILSLPGAVIAVDPTGALTLAQARTTLRFASASAFVFPGTASAFRPLVIWVRLAPQPKWLHGVWSIETDPTVGRADLYTESPGARDYSQASFGMRVPYRERKVVRLRPTALLGKLDSHAPIYVRMALDDESHVGSIAAIDDAATMRREDASRSALASAALFFIGAFVSLAAANLFIFAFVRERPYLLYAGMMLSNALFGATYEHLSAWKWLWPMASIPENPALGVILTIELFFLIAFARSFLETKTLIPRIDRIAAIAGGALMAVAVFMLFAVPSLHFGANVTGRTIALALMLVFILGVLVLGILALLAGSRPARFFVASNAAVTITAVVVGVSSVAKGDSGQDGGSMMLMTGQVVEGWLLFGALAFRLQQTVRLFMKEQQRRIVAQAEALAQAHALLESRKLAQTDALTGIANRRAFDEALAREWKRCARLRAPISLLMIDIDHFKSFNDTYGHVLGDDALRKIATTIAHCAARPTDLCARYGGEEFVLVLPETSEDGARGLAADVLLAVRTLSVPHRGSSLGKVTVSVGVDSAIPGGNAPESLVKLTDTNLYRAKKAGRNRYASSGFIDTASEIAQSVDSAAIRTDIFTG